MTRYQPTGRRIVPVDKVLMFLNIKAIPLPDSPQEAIYFRLPR